MTHFFVGLLQIYPVAPNRTDLLLLIGAIYYQLGNYSQCISFNDRCILIDPHMAEAHANLANALQQLGNFDMAIIYYQVRPKRDTERGMEGGKRGRETETEREGGESSRTPSEV